MITALWNPINIHRLAATLMLLKPKDADSLALYIDTRESLQRPPNQQALKHGWRAAGLLKSKFKSKGDQECCCISHIHIAERFSKTVCALICAKICNFFFASKRSLVKTDDKHDKTERKSNTSMVSQAHKLYSYDAKTSHQCLFLRLVRRQSAIPCCVLLDKRSLKRNWSAKNTNRLLCCV